MTVMEGREMLLVLYDKHSRSFKDSSNLLSEYEHLNYRSYIDRYENIRFIWIRKVNTGENFELLNVLVEQILKITK